MEKIDLHSHTTASDGKTSPSESVRIAKERGLKAIAITDHDTVGGIMEALEEANRLEIEVVPGIEISTLERGQDIHVLGYFIDYQNEAFLHELEKLRSTRQLRNQMMVEKLQELGINISMKEVAAKQTKKDGNIGRPHIAEVLMDKGIVNSLEQAFEEFLGREGRAYVNPPRISAAEGVKLIRKFGGIPVLAHPGLYDYDDLIDALVQIGLKGLEVYHPDHSSKEVEKYEKIADHYGLIATGGSDFHGKRNGIVFHGELGSQPVSVDVLKKLKNLKKS